jgi:shikimate kinase
VIPEKSSLALVGMMGSGKSTVGALLAERLGWTFYDTDLLLEAMFGKPVGEVLEGLGEAEFRLAEDRLVRRLLGLHNAVLATGGGLWTTPGARQRIASFAYTAYLHVPIEILWDRVQAQRLVYRPLLAGGGREALERLLAQRSPVYALADWRIDCGASNPEVIVKQLIRKLRSAGLVAHPERAA